MLAACPALIGAGHAAYHINIVCSLERLCLSAPLSFPAFFSLVYLKNCRKWAVQTWKVEWGHLGHAMMDQVRAQRQQLGCGEQCWSMLSYVACLPRTQPVPYRTLYPLDCSCTCPPNCAPHHTLPCVPPSPYLACPSPSLPVCAQ